MRQCQLVACIYLDVSLFATCVRYTHPFHQLRLNDSIPTYPTNSSTAPLPTQNQNPDHISLLLNSTIGPSFKLVNVSLS